MLCLGVAELSGCGSVGYDSSLRAAQVRFVDVSPGSPQMDIYVNGSGAAYGLGYANFTSYLPALPGTASVSANRAGTGLTLASEEMMFSGGHQYTAVLSHGPGNLQERIYQDEETPAPAGQIAVRVLDEVEGTGSINVYVSSGNGPGFAVVASVQSLTPGAANRYLNLPAAAAYTVTATLAEGALHVPLGSVTVRAGSGAVRTVLFAGTTQGGSKNVVGFVLDDADAP